MQKAPGSFYSFKNIKQLLLKNKHWFAYF